MTKGGGLLGYATDAECIAACRRHIGRLEMVMRECCDAIRDHDESGALRMLEAALTNPPSRMGIDLWPPPRSTGSAPRTGRGG